MKVSFTTRIDCPVNHLWDFYEDVNNLPLWVHGLRDFKITSPPPHGEGTTYVMTMKERGKVVDYIGKNLVWKPRQYVREEMWGGNFKDGDRMTVEYRFFDEGPICRLDYENDFRCGFAMGLIFATAGRLYCKSMINKLKKFAEDTAPED